MEGGGGSPLLSHQLTPRGISTTCKMIQALTTVHPTEYCLCPAMLFMEPICTTPVMSMHKDSSNTLHCADEQGATKLYLLQPKLNSFS